MTTTCPSQYQCNTDSSGWLDGAHPEVTGGIVTRQVCFTNGGRCCALKTQIQVRNCSKYIVYYLHSTPFVGVSVFQRYCGRD